MDRDTGVGGGNSRKEEAYGGLGETETDWPGKRERGERWRRTDK